MKIASAHAKINLALVVGPLRDDGKHEVATVLQRVALADRIGLEPRRRLRVGGYRRRHDRDGGAPDARGRGGVAPRWQVRDREVRSRSPPASAAGAPTRRRHSGSPTTLCPTRSPTTSSRRSRPARRRRPVLPPGRASAGPRRRRVLTELGLPAGYDVLLLLPTGAEKESTAAVYARFDDRGGHRGFDGRVEELLAALASVDTAVDLALLPPNDLAGSRSPESCSSWVRSVRM